MAVQSPVIEVKEFCEADNEWSEPEAALSIIWIHPLLALLSKRAECGGIMGADTHVKHPKNDISNL